MFGLGIFDTIKVVVIGALVVVCAYLVWNYKHMQGVIETQKKEIASVKSQMKIVVNKQKNYDNYIKGGQIIQRKVTVERDTNREALQSGDPAPMLNRLHSYQLRAKGDFGSTPNGGAGSPRPAPARPARP
jgi:hypothetical protein